MTDRRVEGVTGQIKEEAEIPGLNRADRGQTAALGDLIGVWGRPQDSYLHTVVSGIPGLKTEFLR